MTAVKHRWRRDMLVLAQSIEEDLTELHETRPPLEVAATLDVFVQGLVRAWKDMGFSDEAIIQALRTGAEHDFDLDPAWEEQRLQRQAWVAASASSLGQRLNKIQGVAIAAAAFGFLGMILSGALWNWSPARPILIVCVVLFFSGMTLGWLIGKIQASRRAHHLKELRRGLSDRTN
ncbi:MAG: hypothetical protein ACT6RD_09255 [Brevundimonas sp.]|uniref:hypothetical protein n=1 Tax=Brevundimonas sp. TaxID=1871086 RepID=UPI004033C561